MAQMAKDVIPGELVFAGELTLSRRSIQSYPGTDGHTDYGRVIYTHKSKALGGSIMVLTYPVCGVFMWPGCEVRI